MKTLDVAVDTEIEAPVELVRRQFGDVAHHAASGVHRGVVFEVIEDDGQVCRYRQTTTVGPLRLKQELSLARAAEGPLINEVTRGQFKGGRISFDVMPAGASTRVRARLEAPLKGPQRLLARVLASRVTAALTAALAEDRADIESGAYR